ncbi:hypothetical protein KY363_03795 [Candidatus Woesearchaeota archaeon]|nr:hypothetical protein [Candidatus Woesearchaeota archaeon]
MDKGNKILTELKQLEKKVDAASDRHAQHYTAVFVLIAIATVCLSVLIFFGAELTGFVTFSETVSAVAPETLAVSDSGSVDISTDLDEINAILLSGTVTGSGKAAIFLEGEGRNYLAYYFEGDAKDGVRFTDMCYDTCHLEGLGKDNRLWFELEGTAITVDRIKYLYSRIIDFDLEPRVIGIEYQKEPASVIELRLTNRELTDYTVLLYIDGPLSSSFSWQGSLIHMDSGTPEKRIPITVKLPSNLPKGEYVHKISARYVPPGDYEFVGEAPVAETFVTVYA